MPHLSTTKAKRLEASFDFKSQYGFGWFQLPLSHHQHHLAQLGALDIFPCLAFGLTKIFDMFLGFGIDSRTGCTSLVSAPSWRHGGCGQ